MKYHVLPGDAVAEKFAETGIEGEIIVCRECLVDGDVKAENPADFWNVRAEFIEKSFGEPRGKYFQTVVAEFEKLENVSSDAQVNLWFENELFCQTNLWFCTSLLEDSGAEIYRVAPISENENELWSSFGGNDAEDLRRAESAKIKFAAQDLKLGADLWRSFQNSHHAALERLAQTESDCFPHLAAFCRAAAEIKTRLPEILREISNEKHSDFAEIFAEFSSRAGVYGFGDAQVKRILAEI